MAVVLMIARHATALNSIDETAPGANWQKAELVILGDPTNRQAQPGIVSDAYVEHYKNLRSSIFGALFRQHMASDDRVEAVMAFYKATVDFKHDQTNTQTVRKDMTDAFMRRWKHGD
jgi:hypothetical protein